MQTIITKFLGAASTRGTRVKATILEDYGSRKGSSITVPWDYALSSIENYDKAFLQLLRKLNKEGGSWFRGPLENGYIYVKATPGSKATRRVQR